MPAVIKDLISVEMFASLGSNVKVVGVVFFILSYEMERDINNPPCCSKRVGDVDPRGVVYLSWG